jgi:putative hydrolase of the HAD superfamily
VDENLLKLLEEFDLGKLSEEDVYKYFSAYQGVKMTPEEIRKEVDSYLKLDSKLIGLIMKLKHKGFKVALLTNAGASFFEREVYVKYPDFKKLFDEIIISSEIGMVKPNKDIYLYTLEKIGSKPEDCILIDDSKINIEGAGRVGIKGHLYTDLETFSDYLKTEGVI